MAATKFRFPRGSSRAFKLIFPRADDSTAFEDLTAAVYAAFIKRNVLDADADALVDISARVSTLSAGAGEAVLAIFPADTAALDAFENKQIEVRATLADGRVVALEAHSGPLVFPPLTGDPEIAEPNNDFVEAYSPGSAGTPTALPTSLFGSVTLADQDESKAIAFSSAFGAAPRFVTVQVQAPSGGMVVSWTVDVSTITAAGFTAIGGPIPGAGYKLHWFAIA